VRNKAENIVDTNRLINILFNGAGNIK